MLFKIKRKYIGILVCLVVSLFLYKTPVFATDSLFGVSLYPISDILNNGAKGNNDVHSNYYSNGSQEPATVCNTVNGKKDCKCPLPSTVGNNTYVGCSWQCVELAQRYYFNNYTYKIGNFPVDTAADILTWATQSAQKKDFSDIVGYNYNDKNTYPPKPVVGDLVVFQPTSNYEAGHVAVVASVDTNSVTIAEENFKLKNQPLTGSRVLTVDSDNKIVTNCLQCAPVMGLVRSLQNPNIPKPSPPVTYPFSIVSDTNTQFAGVNGNISGWFPAVPAYNNSEFNLPNNAVPIWQSNKITPNEAVNGTSIVTFRKDFDLSEDASGTAQLQVRGQFAAYLNNKVIGYVGTIHPPGYKDSGTTAPDGRIYYITGQKGHNELVIKAMGNSGQLNDTPETNPAWVTYNLTFTGSATQIPTPTPIPVIAPAVQGTPTQISSNGYAYKNCPLVSKNTVAWIGSTSTTSDVLTYDIANNTNTVQVTNPTIAQFCGIAFNYPTLLWNDGGSLHYKNIATSDTKTIGTTDMHYGGFSANGNSIAWVDQNDALNLYKINSGVSTKVSSYILPTDQYNPPTPSVDDSDNKIAWITQVSDYYPSYDVVVKDMNSNVQTRIASSYNEKFNPYISGNYVFWSEWISNGHSANAFTSLMGYNLTTGKQFTVATGVVNTSSIPDGTLLNGANLLWIDGGGIYGAGKIEKIHAMNLSTGVQKQTTINNLSTFIPSTPLGMDGNILVGDNFDPFNPPPQKNIFIEQIPQSALSP